MVYQLQISALILRTEIHHSLVSDERFRIRKPRTSSFPSGHASSAFFAAVLLSGWSTWPAIVVWFVFAVIIATSRAAVRIHHATDILVGATIGALLAVIARITLTIF